MSTHTPSAQAVKSPFGPIADTQQIRLFRIYNHYRMLISLMLTGLLFIEPFTADTRLRWEEYYQAGVFSYLALNVFTGMLMMAGFKPRERHITLSILVDIAILHFLLLTSSGITNGIANLVIVAVAAGNILNPTRMGTFFAALSAIFSLGISGWAVLAIHETADDIVRAGTLGILYFATAFVLQSISKRMIRSEALARSRAKSIAELEQINRQIIQRMRTGILVLDAGGHVRLANAAAEELLFGAQENAGTTLPHSLVLPPAVKEGLAAWRENPDQRIEPFQATPTSPLLQATFTELDQEQGDQTLVFVEDLSKITQQAQQMKLASLGRLTASIAHEIRNPLGAISHAGQLLDESPNLDQGDRQMLDIIHRHSRRVNGIIENVLDLSRRRAADARRIDIAAWLEEFRAEFRQTDHDGSPVYIELYVKSSLPAARFDKTQIEQVMVNLCDNGLRYSKQQTGENRIQLHAGATADGERAYIDVRDFGPGISPEHHNSVFEPFFTTEKTGNGLGLYLARELCEANQAHLSLVDDDQPGCRFRITFAHPGRMI
ncbi:two-component system, NtrC family, sensor histidine kinase PilS [Marinobacter persicus]|uniref:histidine kinase n=1 Tax=Marinobacter persicus TaxID=930118 RepID=A0A1I3X3T6_9GAMM|nr:ATP-binding protein [Marinobacter persicus]GHD48506.1 sensor protein PilS [Marinobacter persicus]SFK13907.1 two-component system, NtrC family, sensor histidine kinase PilS [Marinobacter persicus]